MSAAAKRGAASPVHHPVGCSFLKEFLGCGVWRGRITACDADGYDVFYPEDAFAERFDRATMARVLAKSARLEARGVRVATGAADTVPARGGEVGHGSSSPPTRDASARTPRRGRREGPAPRRATSTPGATRATGRAERGPARGVVVTPPSNEEGRRAGAAAGDGPEIAAAPRPADGRSAKTGGAGGRGRVKRRAAPRKAMSDGTRRRGQCQGPGQRGETSTTGAKGETAGGRDVALVPEIGLDKSRTPEYKPGDFFEGNLELLRKAFQVKDNYIKVLILYSCSGIERAAFKVIQRKLCAKWGENVEINVLSVDMKCAEDGADIDEFDIEEYVGKHKRKIFNMADMSGAKAEKELIDLMEREAPNVILAHPDCTFWSYAGNESYGVEGKKREQGVAMRNRNLPSILAILNEYTNTSKGQACSVILENPNGRLQTRLKPHGKGVGHEKMPHQNTYTPELVDKWGPNTLLAKQTNYWSGGSTEAVEKFPLIHNNPRPVSDSKLLLIEVRSNSPLKKKRGLNAEQKSRTPKPVALTVAWVALLRHAHAVRQEQRDGNVEVQKWTAHPVVETVRGRSRRRRVDHGNGHALPTDDAKVYASLPLKLGHIDTLRMGVFSNKNPSVFNFTGPGYLTEINTRSGREKVFTILPSHKTSPTKYLIKGGERDMQSTEFAEMFERHDYLAAETTAQETILACNAAEFHAERKLLTHKQTYSKRAIGQKLAKLGGRSESLLQLYEDEDWVGKGDVTSPCAIIKHTERVSFVCHKSKRRLSELLDVPESFAYRNASNSITTLSPERMRLVLKDQPKRHRKRTRRKLKYI